MKASLIFLPETTLNTCYSSNRHSSLGIFISHFDKLLEVSVKEVSVGQLPCYDCLREKLLGQSV